jgi:hypothetical protein
MKNFILLFSILLIFTSCNTKQSATTQENVEQTILAMERQSLDRWSAGDPLGFAVNFADDATYFDDIAAQTRIDGLEELQKYLKSLVGKIPPHTYEIVDPKVQVYDKFAIVTLHYHSKIGDEPGPPWKATDVYRLINGKWHVVHAHWSLVKGE